MRTLVILILYVIVAVVSIPLYLVEFIISKINDKAAARFALFMVRVVFTSVLFLSGCKKTIIGRERIPADTPVLYTANHRSFYDIILAYSTVPNQTAFISKMEIKKMPCVAQWMYFLHCQFMERGNVKQNLNIILNAISLINDGYSIYIAPEGTRNATDELLPFKEGSMKIALKSKCPIVPVCIHGTEKIFEDHLPWIRGGKIRIEYGNPVYPDQLDKQDQKRIGAYMQNIIADMYHSASASDSSPS